VTVVVVVVHRVLDRGHRKEERDHHALYQTLENGFREKMGRSEETVFGERERGVVK
jgi:hypothetical protein